MITHSVVISLNSDITYRIFLFSNVLTTSVILLSTYNIKILVLVVSFLNESGCVVLRVIVFTSEDMSVVFVMGFPLFPVDWVGSDSTPIYVGPSLTFCFLETSFLSVSLSPEFSFNSSSIKKDSSEVLDSSSLKSFSSSPVVLSR